MKKILTEAAAVGDITARAISYKSRVPAAYYYENCAWGTPFIGGSYQFLANGVRNLDARTYFFFVATGITPVMSMKMVGKSAVDTGRPKSRRPARARNPSSARKTAWLHPVCPRERAPHA